MWSLRSTREFEKSVQRLPRPYFLQIAKFLEAHRHGFANPFELANLKKMSGHANFYRIRFGGYRLGLEFDPVNRIVYLRHTGKRGDFYRYFPPH